MGDFVTSSFCFNGTTAAPPVPEGLTAAFRRCTDTPKRHAALFQPFPRQDLPARCAAAKPEQGKVTDSTRTTLPYAEHCRWRQPAEPPTSRYRPLCSVPSSNPYHLFTNSWKSCVKTPFGSLGGGCREKEKGFLHHRALMGQKPQCHLVLNEP